MNKDIFHGDWNVLKGKVKEKWGKLTDDDLTAVAGKRDQLLGAIQKRYGIAKDKAHAELSAFEKSLDSDAHHSKTFEGHDAETKGFAGKGTDLGKAQASKETFGKGEFSKSNEGKNLGTEDQGNRGGTQPKKTQKF